MDNFREEIVVRRSGRILYSLVYVVAFITMIITGFIALISLMQLLNGFFDVSLVISLLVSGGLTFLIWRSKDNLRTEYEYSLTNGEMDFAKVMGNTRRKHLLSIHVKNAEQGGPVDSDAYRRIASGPNVKKTDFTLNTDTRHYYLYYLRDGVRNIIHFEPSEKMVALIRLYNKNFAE